MGRGGAAGGTTGWIRWGEREMLLGQEGMEDDGMIEGVVREKEMSRGE